MPKLCTDIADYTHKQCRGCRAMRRVGDKFVCGLGFDVTSHSWPGRAYFQIVRPSELCMRPKTLKAYNLCRAAAMKLGKVVEDQRATYASGGADFDYHTGRKTSKKQTF